MTGLPPAPLPSKTASTPIFNEFMNCLTKDPDLYPPSLELLAAIAIFERHLAGLARRISKLEGGE